MQFFQEMEHFWRGYSDEDRKRIEGYSSYREAAKTYDVVKAQEIATDILEDPFE